MPAATKVVGGLGGAIGCALVPSSNQLVFVEFDTGKLDTLNIAESIVKTLGSGYSQPEDVVVASDGNTAYVTERVGNLLRVDPGNAARASAKVVASGLNTPQQIALDEANARAFVVEYANPGRLLRIDLTSGAVTTIATGLQFPIGIVITSDLTTACVSEQAPGGGRIRKVTLANGAVSNFVTGLTNPFFLTWINRSQQGLFVPERDPANRISVVSTAGGAPVVAVSSVAARPSSVNMTSPGQLLIACDGEIDACNLLPTGDGELLLGIGFVPFNAITAAGLANTTTLSGYFFQVNNAPFGGTLPIIIDHKDAYDLGARYYRVLANGVPGLDVWSDLKLNPATHEFETQIITPVTIGGKPGCYPVRAPGDVWLTANLGDLLGTLALSYGQQNIQVEFINETGGGIRTSNVIRPLVDNSPCFAALTEATLDGNTADPTCGYLPYKVINTDKVTIPYTASQPHNHATYEFQLWKGVNQIDTVTGTVPSPANFTIPLETLMGQCRVAGCAADLYVYATAINGWDRQSQYDRSTEEAFALASAT
jgi:hypothetical protein